MRSKRFSASKRRRPLIRLTLETLEDRRLLSASWPQFALNPQHTAVSAVASQALQAIRWQTPVDLQPQYTNNDLLIHYGSPLITPSNTMIVPVKTGATGGFEVKAFNPADGSMLWTQTTDYILPPLGYQEWIPSYSPVLTPQNRLYFAGAGGTVYYLDNPDGPGPHTVTQIAFYGIANYTHAGFDGSVFINTPITSDSAGDIFFGFEVTGANPLNLVSGLARIDANGAGIWLSGKTATGDSNSLPVHNCAPALSNDDKTVYVVMEGSETYLVTLDNATLATKSIVPLQWPTGGSVNTSFNGTASPMVGPDGDVYIGVADDRLTNNGRGFMLHFSGDLSQTKILGAFGWDDTASVVPASMVPSYHGTSNYLILTKYNNYVQAGGNGMNRMAVLDPNGTEVDPISGATVMKEVLTVLGPTPNRPLGGVDEWCINTAAVDLFTKSILVNSEDGKLYRWDMASNTLTQSVTFNAGIGEAYTPTLIGPDGTVYAISNAILYAVDAVTHFSISAPANSTAGSVFSITVTAQDENNQTAASYLGTVQFTSTDNQVGVALPPNYTFTAADNGVHTFTNGVALDTAGNEIITAMDTANSSIQATATVTVTAAATAHMGIFVPAVAKVGYAFHITVTALDPFQNRATSYTGTVHFSSSDPGPGVLLPGDYTFTSGDTGSHTFTNGVTLQTTGNQTVSAQDTVTSSIQGSAYVSVINPVPTISSLSQNSAVEGSPTMVVTIGGSGFVHSSTAQWKGVALTTTFISMTTLQAAIPASNLAEEGSAQLTVINPVPGGGTSNPASFTITDASLSASGAHVIATKGAPFTRVVATFTDVNSKAPLGDFTGPIGVRIFWGDNTQEDLAPVSQPGGTGSTFIVTGSHIYSNDGTYTLSVEIHDVGGAFTTIPATIQVMQREAGIAGRALKSGQWWVGTSNGSNAFNTSLFDTWDPNVTWVDVVTGDFNGDGRTDIAGRVLQSGQWWVGKSTGSSFTTSLWTTWDPMVTWVDVKVGDFTGNGMEDIAGRVLQSGDWWVAQSNGTSFTNSLWTHWYAGVTWSDVKVGDFNGDAKADIAGRVLQSGDWWVAQSSGSSFSNSRWTTWDPNVTWVDVQVGNFSGHANGMDDIAGRVLESGDWWMAQSNGSSFSNSRWTTWDPNVTWVDVKVGDFNGDGKADIIGRVAASGDWWVAKSTGSSFTNSFWAHWYSGVTWVDVQVGDFNGDGLADITGRVLESGQWWTGISTGSGFQTALWAVWSSSVTWTDVQESYFS